MTFFFYLYMMGNWFQKKNACVKHMALPFCLCKILQRTRTKCNTTHYWPFLNPNKKLPNYFEPGWQQLCKVMHTWYECMNCILYWIKFANLQLRAMAIFAFDGRLPTSFWHHDMTWSMSSKYILFTVHFVPYVQLTLVAKLLLLMQKSAKQNLKPSLNATITFNSFSSDSFTPPAKAEHL